jgi:hypothetical protein
MTNVEKLPSRKPKAGVHGQYMSHGYPNLHVQLRGLSLTKKVNCKLLVVISIVRVEMRRTWEHMICFKKEQWSQPTRERVQGPERARCRLLPMRPVSYHSSF